VARELRQAQVPAASSAIFPESARAYGGREAYKHAKAADQVKLTYGQWVQVRAPAFKTWFENWEEVTRMRSIVEAARAVVRSAGEATAVNLLPDLPKYGGCVDVILPCGDARYGQSKILGRRGPEVTVDLLRAVALGEVESYTPAIKTAGLAPNSARAMLRLARYRQQETWLLTRWDEGRPDVTGEVGTRSGTTQRSPTFSRDALGADLEKRLAASQNVSKVTDAKNRNGPDRVKASPGAAASPLGETPLAGAVEPFVRQPFRRVNSASDSKVTDPETGEPLVVNPCALKL